MITVDFETEAIQGNPILHPPRPVGVAINNLGDSEYLVGEEMVDACKRIWHSENDLLFHNAPFDLSVARTHLGLEFPSWERIHDTMYLVYLKNPHADSLSLKPSAEHYLGLPPQDQDNLRDWILANVKKATSKNWGAFICEAPFELVKPYAISDVVMTRGLYDNLKNEIPLEPYNRERELMPILVEATRKGVRVNRPALESTLDRCEQLRSTCDQLVRARLGVGGDKPLKGLYLADALDAAGKMDSWVLTPTGKRSTAKDNLLAGINDMELLSMLTYSSTINTYMNTFIEPWLNKSVIASRLHPNWNQVRSTEGQRKGTRTGRMSSDNPNFQNPPNVKEMVVPEGLEPLPNLRSFILPEEGCVWLKRDFSSQEIRILAHFEEGALLQAYKDNPDLDPHSMVQKLIYDMLGKEFPRKFVKEAGFGMIYGMGPNALSKKIGCSISEAKDVQDAYKLAVPGVGMLQAGTKKRGREGRPITTWGNRSYYVEEPKIIRGSYRSFEYKLLNYLIQGSAADQTKQCIIDWDGDRGEATFMTVVHDEINISAPAEYPDFHMSKLKAVMDRDLFDCPMRSEGFVGPNWGDLKDDS